MVRYLKLNNLDNDMLEKVEQALLNLEVDYEVFNYSTGAFWKEEADFQLEHWEECNHKIEDEVLRNRLLDKLEDRFMDSDYVIDNELLMDLTRDCVDEVLSETK